MNSRREFTKTILGAFFALVFIVLFSTFYFLLSNSAVAQNGSLYLSPSSGQVSVGQTFSLVLRVNTGGTAINAAEGSVVFDPAKLNVSSVSKSGSIFTIWAEEPKFSNAEGTIEFAGGIPNPGYSGSNGLVLAINFRAKTATSVSGSTDITLVSGGILANDGYGTNILSSLGKATYTIAPGVIQPASPTPSARPSAPVADAGEMKIISPTHPDQSKWYSNKNPIFKWDMPIGVNEVTLVLSRRANSPPIISYSPPISEKLLEDLDDGEWYLNARFKTAAGLGPVTSFKFNVDTEPPSAFSITRLDTEDSTNPRPELFFESSDVTSGMDYYELRVNNGGPVTIPASEAGQSYAMPLQTPGAKDIEIKAFDQAGNTASARLMIQVESIDVPRLDRVSVEVREGKPLTVEGTAKPNQKVLIYFVHENDKSSIRIINTAYAQHMGNGEPKKYETIADANGRFKLTTVTDLPVGKYKVFAKAQDERGAVSSPSNDMPTEIRRGFWDFIFRIFDWFVNVLSGKGLFIAFLTALVGLMLVLVELIKVHAGKNIKKLLGLVLVKIVRKKSIKKVEHIIKDMKDELQYLRRIEKRRPLNTEEKYLKSKISSYLKMLKHIDREIHNKE